jgi:uncharacterized protein (TIGR02118 family)
MDLRGNIEAKFSGPSLFSTPAGFSYRLVSPNGKCKDKLAMIKLIMCVYRRPELSRDEFQDYWLNKHGPLLQKFATSYKVCRYVQSHTMDTPLNKAVQDSRGISQEYDGIAELWWESESEFIDAINSIEGKKLRTVFLDDEAKFLDFSRSAAFFTKEHVLVGQNG